MERTVTAPEYAAMVGVDARTARRWIATAHREGSPRATYVDRPRGNGAPPQRVPALVVTDLRAR